MAQFFSAKRSRNKAVNDKLPKIEVSVDTIDHHGNGIYLSHKPIIVIAGGLLGERYLVQVKSQKSGVWHADVVTVFHENAELRALPFCKYFKECGGCSHQHIRPQAFLQAKQSSLRSYIYKHVAQHRLNKCVWEDPLNSLVDGQSSELTGEKPIEYRRRARLAIDARNKSNPKIGFRKSKSNKVVDVDSCPVFSSGLQKVQSAIISLLKQLPDLSHIGHIILTEGVYAVQVSLHLTKALSRSSVGELRKFQSSFTNDALEIVYQVKNGAIVEVSSAELPDVEEQNTSAALEVSDLTSYRTWVKPTQFIQVNKVVNQKMLSKVSEWLALDGSEHVIDLFSGVGNFGLALAPMAKRVVGYEGIASMVQQARMNAQRSGIDNIEFEHVDLTQANIIEQVSITENSILVIDPSREGALAVATQLSDRENVKQKGAQNKHHILPKKIVYVSCNPTSFIRDLNAMPAAYAVTKLCALDMFPYTKHLELMALLEIQP
ncbi:23S rRNA (uracil(1939)-C(5))-methyltransferase RlmD [Glaciecola sp. MH2013]|uniref:23S rRNA (uracil(1939)-C(5))-methyltransferase RlmD n=1 Tax=Glaciecola sp. MH2013 TaxID=2785524 RepID=UPI00189E71EA|nr:23S rRNA (uracil(1939)-C(5))-methyltransferase RlmD [Glaciecola sp. MH2013]MBF7075060.1 23S rRNA (uracil(1939)-C(5))-methyltransferase RlmD [Glaciecola sp. MH2013]